MDGIIRVDDTQVHKAIREALVNCLVNADYYMPQGIVIKMEEESLTIENPGNIRTGKKQMLRGGISDPRNKTLMKMFNLIGIGERAGSGIPDIFQVWKEAGWKSPKIEENFNPDRTKLLLEFVEKQANKASEQNKRIKASEQNKRTKASEQKQANKSKRTKTSEQKQANKNKRTKTEEHCLMIRKYLKKNGLSKTTDIAEYIGLSPTRTRAILTEMSDVTFEGTTNNRKYKLL